MKGSENSPHVLRAGDGPKPYFPKGMVYKTVHVCGQKVTI